MSLEISTNGEASLVRRLKFARDSHLFFDRLICGTPLSVLARYRDWSIPRVPDHWARLAYDLVECLRTGHVVPDMGNAELALLHARGRIAEHPRYRSYWYDAARHSMVGMFAGADLIHHQGKYYVIELNQGPSMYTRRRAMYDSAGDPAFLTILSLARTFGFTTVAPIAFQWAEPYLDELPRLGREHGISVTPLQSPLRQTPAIPRILALPKPLARNTLYVEHSGLAGPAFRFLDNKWYASKWLRQDLPSGGLVALPATSEELFVPSSAIDARWPNLVIKLAGGARSCNVLAARFEDEEEARRALGLEGGKRIPRQLRAGYAKNILLDGGDRVIYQEFIPPEIDERGHARMIRLHMFVSPLGTRFLSTHFRISRRPLPVGAPRGIIRRDDAFIFNDADYALLPPDMEEELRLVARDLGAAVQRALERTFQTTPDGSTLASR